MTPQDAHDKSGWMQTYSGLAFWPLKPDPANILITDIAHSLSMMCRYAGHCKNFYSVAEHCVHVAEAAPPELKLTALMHDASEPYLVDVPRPIKPFLTGYYDIEANLMEVISKKFSLIHPLPEEIKQLDTRILTDERQQNMSPMDVKAPLWGNTGEALGVDLQFWSPAVAKFWFLERFYEYGGRA